MQVYLKDWGGEQLISCFDQPTGSLILIGIHSSILGPATGGTRMMSYASDDLAISDCLRLSKSMTYKFALADFPRGGGKAVISIPASLSDKDRKGLLKRYGQLVNKLNGLFYTGPDIGISQDDLEEIGKYAPNYVFCKTNNQGQANHSGEATALGVLSAIKSTIWHLYSNDELENKVILVQGAGSVGHALILLLLEEKASVLFTDIKPPSKILIDKGAQFVAPEEIFKQECIVFSPCAQGGILDNETIKQLNCKAVVGAANNQLVNDEALELLREKDILYAPDFAVNIGGAMVVTGIETFNWSNEKVSAEIEKIGSTLELIYDSAEEKNISTVDAALEIVRNRLQQKVYDL